MPDMKRRTLWDNELMKSLFCSTIRVGGDKTQLEPDGKYQREWKASFDISNKYYLYYIEHTNQRPSEKKITMLTPT